VLELATVVDVCFALPECPLLEDTEVEAEWLEVAAEARTAMLKAKIAENCMLTVAVVALEVCRWCWSMVLVDGVDGELYLSWESSDFFTVLIHRLHRVHAFFQETTIAYCGLQARIKAGVVPLFQAQSATR